MAELPLIGEGAPRIDGRLKVTGDARYAADFSVPNPAYAQLVTSTIARGRIVSLDASEAGKVPGVLKVYTHENAPKIEGVPFFGKGGQAYQGFRPLQGVEIKHEGQIIALVVAETLEAAREAAFRVKATYEPQTPAATFGDGGTETEVAAEISKQHTDPKTGDADAALKDAAHVVEAEYETATNHHNAMELYSTTAHWTGDHLTIYEPSQWVYGLRAGVAGELGIPQDKVRVLSPFTGGAFGSKGTVTARSALTAAAARALNRPVKLLVTRAQGYTTASYRAETKHRIRLGADGDGTFVGFVHEGFELTSRPDTFLVSGTESTVRMYGFKNVRTKVSAVRADRNTPGFMRSPAEVPYMFALESAVDELAWKIGMDPIELRLKNDTKTDPITGKPFTTRQVRACFERAKELFGWDRRVAKVGAMRADGELVGYGAALACYPTQLAPAAVRLTLEGKGRARVQIAAHDIGTGTYTVLAQAAAGLLGVALDRVEVELGDTNLPAGPISGGSVATASSVSAIMKAAEAIRLRLATAATTSNDGPLAGKDKESVVLKDGRLVAEDGTGEDLTDAFKRLGVGTVEEYAEWLPDGVDEKAMRGLYNGSVKIVGGPMQDRTQFSFGAELVEVRVNPRTLSIRVPRMVGVFASGRIMNRMTAGSQVLGGMVWGVGSALHEQTEIDRRYARYVNDNIAEYLVPVNADIVHQEIEFLEEDDGEVNLAGVKGLGELGNVGTNAAVANAVYHATGFRARKIPIRIEDVLKSHLV
ncbi:MAG: xanthine dehydrogenase family protein molybdopterin-binding subunit [Geminicoccaceae bacterium]|nr:xanthine dehydrogenase family protein molybdopterin-binding subunit [Geminicoccaceae bacterium]